MRNALNWGNAQRARVVFAWRFPERRRAPQIAYKTVSFAHEDRVPNVGVADVSRAEQSRHEKRPSLESFIAK